MIKQRIRIKRLQLFGVPLSKTLNPTVVLGAVPLSYGLQPSVGLYVKFTYNIQVILIRW